MLHCLTATAQVDSVDLFVTQMMVSLSNGCVSGGDTSNKRPLENGYVPKYKPRKICAIRDFPPGCGCNVVSMNINTTQNGANEAGTMDDLGSMNAVAIPEMDYLKQSEVVGNSEVANKIDSDGGKTAEMPNFVKSEAKYSEAGGSHGIENSNIEAHSQSYVAAKHNNDVEMTGQIDGFVETKPLGIQVPEDPQIHDIVNNHLEVEGTASVDAFMGEVTATTMDGIEKLTTETELVGLDKMNESKNNPPREDTEDGGPRVLSLDLLQHSATDMENRTSKVGASAGKDPLLVSGQILVPSCGIIEPETLVQPMDKYCRRRVSAVRDFPPHCGRNIPQPIENQKLIVTSRKRCLDEIEKVELDPEATMSRHFSESGGIEETMMTSQKECLDKADYIHVKEETTETLNDGGAGPMGEIVEDIKDGSFVHYDEGNWVLKSSNKEEMETRHIAPGSLPLQKSLTDTSSKDAEKEPRGMKIATWSPDGNDAIRTPPSGGLSAGDDLCREVVHGLMAAPFSIWKKGKMALNNSESGTNEITVQMQNLSQQADVECIPLVTPISMFDGNVVSVGKEIVVHPPEQSDELRPSNSISNSANEVDTYLAHGQIASSSRKVKMADINTNENLSGKKKGKQNMSWRQKAKAVARKTTPKAKVSGLTSKKHKKGQTCNDAGVSSLALVPAGDETHDHEGHTSSPVYRKTREFEVNLPPVGPKSSGSGDIRNRVRETLRIFHVSCRKLLQQDESNLMPEEEGKSRAKLRRIDLLSAKMIRELGKEVNTEKQYLGAVPGVEVGDEFQYRAELAIVGIHRHYQNGIDCMKLNGKPVATSVVSSGAYADDVENGDVLIYTGQGGNVVGKSKIPEDQKLERGNLALKNSISTKTPVRVVRGWKVNRAVDPSDPKSKSVPIYVYDGLYMVTKYWEEMGDHGKKVFKFHLSRNPGQPELAWKELKKVNKSKRPDACVDDISRGKERQPICAVNTLDDDKPPPFNYISKMMYPAWFKPNPPAGCDCTGRCSDSKKCRCAVRNGGEIPYNRNGAIVETKTLVYECGPHCKCPETCYNRVSQRGIKFKLEIFKTESRGWGVRALTSIPSGSFICEYVGELLEDKEAEQRIGNDEYLFDIGYNYSDTALGPENNLLVAELTEGGYTIDAAQYGSIGRFINHSCSPNLYAQNVIYDHDDKRMPHVMLFAMENIPPLKELTYHYNYSVDQIYDSEGNIKVKKCYCGSVECTGRMY